MKSVIGVKKEMSELKDRIKELESCDDKKSIALRKRLRKKISELKQYILYLETNPTKEYCEKEVNRLSSRINEISKLYIEPAEPERFTKGQLSAMKKAFEKHWEVPKIRKQLMAVSYILKQQSGKPDA